MLLKGYNSSPLVRGKIKNATRRNKCPVCNGVGCGLIDGGKVVLCWRESSGSSGQTQTGSYIHKTEEFTASTYVRPEEPPKIISAKTDTVYKTFLESLTLRDKHYNHLSKFRRLSDETIKLNQFKSIPTITEARQLVAKLGRKVNLEHVPGFFFDGEWRLNVKGSGFFVPYRDINQSIQGMQVRLDFGDMRYLWLSSGKFESGASPGAPIHYCRPELVTDKVWITEGGLKAICISEYESIPVIAIGGVTAVNYENFFRRIHDDLPLITKIAIVFDADWKKNTHVANALGRMGMEAQKQNYEVSVLDWDEKIGKGYDDYVRNTRRSN